MSEDLYDVTVVGAGPTGLFAAFYAGLREMRTKVVEALPEPGGQLTVLYPEKFIYDAPGFRKILAKDLVNNLYDQASQFNPTFCFEEQVRMLTILPDKTLKLETDRNSHHTKTLIICAGIGAFEPNKLQAPGVSRFEGKGVYYFVKEKAGFRGKHILIVGGGDSAVDWALNLRDWARKVTLIHRRDRFRAHERSVAELLASRSGVDVKLFHELKEVHGGDRVEGATIFHNKTGEETYLPVDAIIVNIGYKAHLGPISEWGLEIANRAIKVDGNMRTNLPGVYAAGDVATQENAIKVNLIAVGFAQAAIAVNHAKKYIDPTAPTFEHSSEKRL